ncbi:MAG: hypothetical protein AAF990_21925, partial [Bacteroidota bacterium]
SSTASGQFSVAIGPSTTASESYTIAKGYKAEATSRNAVAIGSFAEAKGRNALALGNRTEALGVGATAAGHFANAYGKYSTALGNTAEAFDNTGTAIGILSDAVGEYATAIGRNTEARSYSEVAIGNYNTTDVTNDPNNYVSTDRLLVFGNGRNSSTQSDAMIIYKNGNAKITGNLEINSLKGNSAFSNLAISDKLQFGSSGKFRLDEGSWQTGNIELTSGSGTFGFYGTGINRLHLRTDGNLTVDGSIQVGGGTIINKILSGQFHVGSNSSGGGAKTVTIHFGSTFSSAPMILVTPQEANGGYNDVFITTIKSISTSSVTLNVYRIDSPGAGWGQQLKLNWMAWN